MTTIFERPLYGFRFAEIQRGDSLRTIAARELGDSSRWIDLVNFNNLVPPYVTDDPAQAGDRVRLSGERLLIPAPAPVVTNTLDPDQVFETDVALNNGQLNTDGGDFLVVSGRSNLKQALKNAVETERGGLLLHSSYGSLVRRVLGSVNGPTAGLLAAQYARAVVQADPRIRQVSDATAEIIGDVVNVSVKAEPVTGETVQFNANP